MLSLASVDCDNCISSPKISNHFGEARTGMAQMTIYVQKENADFNVKAKIEFSKQEVFGKVMRDQFLYWLSENQTL